MATWYAQLASQNFNAPQQWNSIANGTGDWLDTAVTDYSNDTFYSNGKIVVITNNLTCAQLKQDSNFFRFAGTGLIVNADIEVDTTYSSIDIQPDSDLTIYGDLFANGTENAAICMYQNNTSLNIYGDIICTGDNSIGVMLTSGDVVANVFNGTLIAGGEYSACLLSSIFGAAISVSNCTLMGGAGYGSNAIRLEDGTCSIENSTLIAGEGFFCEAVNSLAYPAVINASNMISSEYSMPVAGSMIYTPQAQNYYEIWGAITPATMAVIPDIANIKKGVVCGSIVGTLAPASPFRRLNRLV